MCGIVGYIGKENAAPILLEGLKKLEYRGYDSAGVALAKNGEISVIKTKKRLSELETMVESAGAYGTAGIGHTRWATHGAPSDKNAHPHFNADKSIVLVHNGIIENYKPLRAELEAEGYTFASDTDTEVIAHLLDRALRRGASPIEAMATLPGLLVGSYALGVLFAREPGVLYAARKDSPLVIGLGEDCHYLASDVPAILSHTRRVVYMDNRQIARLTCSSVELFSVNDKGVAKPVPPCPSTVDWDQTAAEKGGFAHFMMKEIHEQPAAIRATLSQFFPQLDLEGGEKPVLHGEPLLPLLPESLLAAKDLFAHLSRIYFVACGSANHVGVVGKYVMEELTRIPSEADLASEFRYRNPVLEKNSLCIIVSQSGETADSLAALSLAKERGIPTLAIVNVVGSSIAREADYVLYTRAGPEISVATTKAYSAQLAVVYALALALASIKGAQSAEALSALSLELLSLPDKVASLLEKMNAIRDYAERLKEIDHAFFIGRGIDYAAALEGSLKLKEVSYVHSEAYAAGELKHGTISLIEPGTPVVVLATQPSLFEKVSSNAEEVLTRGAKLFVISQADRPFPKNRSEFSVLLPPIAPVFAASLAVVPLQIFAYFIAMLRGLDVDKPRNLAKSVTVE